MDCFEWVTRKQAIAINDTLPIQGLLPFGWCECKEYKENNTPNALQKAREKKTTSVSNEQRVHFESLNPCWNTEWHNRENRFQWLAQLAACFVLNVIMFFPIQNRLLVTLLGTSLSTASPPTMCIRHVMQLTRQIKEASQTPLYAAMIHRPNSWSLHRQHNMLIAFFNIQSWSLIIFSEFNIAVNERKRVDTRVWGGKVITKGHELCSVYRPYHTWRKMTDQRFFLKDFTTKQQQQNLNQIASP